MSYKPLHVIEISESLCKLIKTVLLTKHEIMGLDESDEVIARGFPSWLMKRQETKVCT